MFAPTPIISDTDIYHSSLGGVDLAIPYYLLEYYEFGTKCLNIGY
jgi:hypothetical protein